MGILPLTRVQPTVLVVHVASRRAAPRRAARTRRHTAHHVCDHDARMTRAHHERMRVVCTPFARHARVTKRTSCPLARATHCPRLRVRRIAPPICHVTPRITCATMSRAWRAYIMNACASCTRHSLVMLASRTGILPPTRAPPTSLVLVRVASRSSYATPRRASRTRP